MFASAVSIVVVVFLMIAVGVLCHRRNILGDNAPQLLSRLTLRVALPGLVVSNLLTQYDRRMLLDNAAYLLIPILVMGGMYLLSRPLSAWLKIPERRRGVFRCLFTFGNTVFVGLPVCRAMFGEEAVPIALLYYLVNTVFWWSVGAQAVTRDSGVPRDGVLKRLVSSPPLVACIISLLLVMLGVTLPEVVMRTASYLGAMVTPLSMLFLGYVLSDMAKKGIKWEKGYGVMLASRLVIGPAVCLLLCTLLSTPMEVLQVFFIQSGMPAQTQTSLWAKEAGADAEYAAGGIALSTLAGLVGIPLMAGVLALLG